MSRGGSVGALELAAKNKAVERISKIIRRTDQLEKVTKLIMIRLDLKESYFLRVQQCIF